MSRRWGAAGAVLLAILAASLAPDGAAGGLPLAPAAHLVGYGALAASLAVSLDDRTVLAFALAVLVGAGVEAVQPWVGRDASLLDAATNAVGAGAALALLAARRGR